MSREFQNELEMKKLSGDSSELFFNTNENNQNSIAWFAGELGKSMIGKGFGGSDGTKNKTNKTPGTKKMKKPICMLSMQIGFFLFVGKS